jgi:membrane protein
MKWLRRVGQLFTDAGSAFLEDHCWRRSASLSYCAVFSIFPLLLLCVVALGFVLGDDDSTRRRLVASFSDAVTPASRSLIDDTLHSLQTHRTVRGVGAAVGIVTLLFGASGVFAELESSLDSIWRVPEEKHESTFRAILSALRSRAFSFLAVIGAALVLLVSLGLSTALASMTGRAAHEDSGAWLWRAVEMVSSLVLQAALIATLFRVIPHVKLRWRDVLAGAVVTSIGLALSKVVFGLYLTHLGGYAAYGAVGMVLALLLWIYIAAMVVFYGAEVCHAYTRLFGGQRDVPKVA